MRRVIGLWVAVAAMPAAAQVRIGATAGLVSHIEGPVHVEAPPGKVLQMRDGSSIRSGPGGRAEVLLNACAVLHLGDNSALLLISTSLTDTRIELLGGSAMVEADRIVPETKVTVLVRGASATVTRVGLYRFDSDPARLSVKSGKISAHRLAGRVDVPAGRRASLDTAAAPEKFNRDREDALDRYNRRRAATLSLESGALAQMERRQVAVAESSRRASEMQSRAPLPNDMDPVPPAPVPPVSAHLSLDRPLICPPAGK